MHREHERQEQDEGYGIERVKVVTYIAKEESRRRQSSRSNRGSQQTLVPKEGRETLY